MTAIRRASRRHFLAQVCAAFGAASLAGCDRLSQNEQVTRALAGAEELNAEVAKLVTGRRAMAQEYSDADLSPTFRSNGTANPDNAAYQALAAGGFAEYALKVDGLVAKPRSFTLAELQIGRASCRERV